MCAQSVRPVPTIAPPRGARRFATVAAFVVASVLVSACASRLETQPTQLRTDYNSLGDLYDIIEWTTERLTREMRHRNWKRAEAHGDNLVVYADDLRQFTPRQRTRIEIEQYDQLAGRIVAVAEAAAHNAHMMKRIQGLKECDTIVQRVRELQDYLRRPRDENPGTWTERPDPSPVIGPDDEIMIP